MMLRLISWMQDDAPVWSWLIRVENGLRWLYCRLHGHSRIIDMDDRTHYCAVCGHVPAVPAVPAAPAARRFDGFMHR